MTDKQQLFRVLLSHARDTAGGVSYLARRLGVGADRLDAMLCGREPIPSQTFVAALDFVLEAEERGSTPPGLPADWQRLSANRYWWVDSG